MFAVFFFGGGRRWTPGLLVNSRLSRHVSAAAEPAATSDSDASTSAIQSTVG